MRFDSSGAVSAGMFDETWRRFVIKMATGSGKTKVLSLALAWSFFHKLYEPDSELSRNFLVIAPNIIVLDRIYQGFPGAADFLRGPGLPDNGFDGRNWRDDFQLTLHMQDEVRVTHPTGNIFLTNIHRVYSGDDIPPSPDDDNTMDYFLGKRPTGATTDSKVDLGMIVRDIDELMVLNDEAHHIHDPRLAWFKSIEDIHNRLLQKGGSLSLQVDVTATPKHNNGAIFVQTVADYPLVEAISQNVVKHPVLPDAASRAKLLGTAERQIHREIRRLHPSRRDRVAQGLRRAREDGQEGHPVRDDRRHPQLRRRGRISGRPLPRPRRMRCWSFTPRTTARFPRRRQARPRKSWKSCAKQANEIDEPDSPYKAIVSVHDAQGRLGRAQRHHHRRPARLFGQEQHPARADPWARPAQDVSRRRWRNTSASSAPMPSWISSSPSRPRAWSWNASRWAKGPSPRRRWSSRSTTRTTRRTSTRWISRSRC